MMISREKLYAVDTSQSVKTFLAGQQQDLQMSLQCGLSMQQLVEPVRHMSLQKLCVMEMEFFLEYLTLENWKEKEQIKCPICNQKKEPTYFGICRLTLNLIELLKLQGQSVPKQVTYKNGTGRFYKDDIEIIGLNPLKNNLRINSQLQNIPKHQLNGLGEIINSVKSQFALQGLILERISQKLQLNSSQMIQQRINQAYQELVPLLEKNINFKILGEEEFHQLKLKFCFGFFNMFQSPQNNKFEVPIIAENILVIYSPFLKVWKEFRLLYENKPFKLNFECLCIKEIQKNEGIIYLLGGYQQSPSVATNDFYMIRFPLDPSVIMNNKIFVTKLPNLPYKCLGPQGFVNNGRIFMWGGFTFQQNTTAVESQLFIFERNAWISRSEVQFEKRIDGSLYVDHQASTVMIFGGYLQKASAKEDDMNQEMVKTVEVFQFEKSQKVSLQFEYGRSDRRILANKTLIAPLSGSNYLVLGGRYLGVNLRQSSFKPIISQINLVSQQRCAILTQHDFTQQCTYILDRIENQVQLQQSERKANEQVRDVYNFLVHDYEGVLYENRYFTIYNLIEDIKRKSIKRTKMSVYSYDLTNGKNQFIPFSTSRQAIDVQLILEKFVVKENFQIVSLEHLKQANLQRIEEQRRLDQERQRQMEEQKYVEEQRKMHQGMQAMELEPQQSQQQIIQPSHNSYLQQQQTTAPRKPSGIRFIGQAPILSNQSSVQSISQNSQTRKNKIKIVDE